MLQKTIAGSLLIIPTIALAGLAPYIDYGNVLYAEPIMKTIEVMVPEEVCVPVAEKILFPAPNHMRYYIGPPLVVQEAVVATTAVEGQFDTPPERLVAAGQRTGRYVVRNVRELVVQEDIYPIAPPTLIRERPPVVIDKQMSCSMVPKPQKQKIFDGYQVTYVYNGQTFVIRTAEKPGRQVKVLVTTNATPVVQ